LADDEIRTMQNNQRTPYNFASSGAIVTLSTPVTDTFIDDGVMGGVMRGGRFLF
jgi:hypothetical protein